MTHKLNIRLHKAVTTPLLGLALLMAAPGCGSSSDNSGYFTAGSDDEESLDTETLPADTDTLDIAETELEAPAFEQAYGDVAIPFTEEAGVKLVNVEINGSIGVHMIIDSGCSGTLISLAEADYLVRKGVLDESDIVGQQTSQIADGSLTVNTVVRLRQLLIDGQILCTDVEATVAENMNAPLLLGNEVLNRTGSYTVDNENGLLVFHNVPIY